MRFVQQKLVSAPRKDLLQQVASDVLLVVTLLLGLLRLQYLGEVLHDEL